MNKILQLESWLFLLLFGGLSTVGFAIDSDPERWESAIRQFESADKSQFPDQVDVLFLGSSSIKLWDLGKYFPGRQTLNRGFGGSQISDSLYYADRLVFPYSPSTIVFYAGDNDIAAGKSPQTVFRDYQAFVEKIHRQWPIDRDYMAPPSQGKLAALDPALLVTPPAGMELGYVPIVTHQQDAKAP